MLGGAILRTLLNRGEDAEGWSFSTYNSPDGLEFRAFDLDALGPEGWVFESVFREKLPRVLIHCAALTDVDYCQNAPGHSRRINAHVPERLAKTCAEAGTRFIYISSDAIYDGDLPGRRHEDEQPKPLSVYAESKLEGEGRVLTAYPESLVCRTTMFGWTIPLKRPKFAEEILGALTQRRSFRLFTDAVFSPLHVYQLAEIILDLAEMDVSGVLNVGARDPISKYDFGRVIADTFGYDPQFLEEGNVGPNRPKNVGLNVTKLTQAWGQPPSVESGIARLYREVFDGRVEAIRGRTTFP